MPTAFSSKASARAKRSASFSSPLRPRVAIGGHSVNGDLRRAARSLSHRPGLALSVVLTLMLSIGANSAIFSAVDAVLLKPLPYPDADRLVAVYESNLARRESTSLVAPGR